MLDAVRIDRLDSYQLSTNQPLTSAGYPPYGKEMSVGFYEATVRDQVTLRQETTPGGNLLQPA